MFVCACNQAQAFGKKISNTADMNSISDSLTGCRMYKFSFCGGHMAVYCSLYVL